MLNLDALWLEEWTPIAAELPKKWHGCKWREFSDGPMNLKTARELQKKGLILMAHRKTEGLWEVVIKAPAPHRPQEPRGRRARSGRHEVIGLSGPAAQHTPGAA